MHFQEAGMKLYPVPELFQKVGIPVSVADPGCLFRIPDPGSLFLPIPDPGSLFLPIPDPGSRIPDPKTVTKREVKKICYHTFFCSHKFHKI
jgi:hypothetical protein